MQAQCAEGLEIGYCARMGEVMRLSAHGVAALLKQAECIVREQVGIMFSVWIRNDWRMLLSEN